MLRSTTSLIALLGLLVQTSPAPAHPLVSDDTGTQGLGGTQIELRFDYARSRDAGITDTYRSIPFTYTHGFQDDLDGFIGTARQLHPAVGWENVGVGVKWRFYENELNQISLAIKPELLFPVSASGETKGLGNGKTSYGLTLVLTKETSFGELHFNLAAQRNNFEDHTITDRKNLYRASFAPVWNVSDNWKMAFDAGLETNPDSSEKPQTGYVELGAVYSPSSDLDLSLGVIKDSLGTSTNSVLVTLLATWRFR